MGAVESYPPHGWRGTSGISNLEIHKSMKPKEQRERATALEYLQWFCNNADFGPADSDVKESMNERFMDETGKNLPEGWNYASDGETTTDL